MSQHIAWCSLAFCVHDFEDLHTYVCPDHSGCSLTFPKDVYHGCSTCCIVWSSRRDGRTDARLSTWGWATQGVRCACVNSRYIGNCHPTFTRESFHMLGIFTTLEKGCSKCGQVKGISHHPRVLVCHVLFFWWLHKSSLFMNSNSHNSSNWFIFMFSCATKHFSFNQSSLYKRFFLESIKCNSVIPKF